MEAFPFLIALFFASLSPSAHSSTNFRGVPPQDLDYFQKGTIWCKDGSNSFSSEQLNDDYCDCPDGTDEPGTSACANGKFYCQNKGYTPLWIFSSRVNDGICDCCDGSDEYDKKKNCVNTCSEAGKSWRDKLKKEISTTKTGLKIRKQEIETGKLMIEKEKLELANLKLEEKRLKDIVKKLDAKKQVIEKAEEKERLLREKEEKARKDAEREKAKTEELENQEVEPEAENKVSGEVEELEDQEVKPEAENKVSGKVEELEDQEVEPDAENKVSGEVEELEDQKDVHDSKIHSAEQDTTEDLSREELGRLVASRWTGENPTMEKEDLVEQKNDYFVGDETDEKSLDKVNVHKDYISTSMPEEHIADDDKYDDDDDDGEDDDDDDEDRNRTMEDNFSDKKLSDANPSLWSRIKGFFQSFSDIFIFPNLPVDKSEADQIRKDYQKSNLELSDIRTKISDLEKKLEQDFGKDGEFYSLYGKCVELQEKKYTYKVCPYKHGLQTEGHSSTRLGAWDGFKDDYKSMQFAHGDRCWNGPDRSLKVQLRCGTKIELRDVDEPSRCEYVAELSTPAVCLTETLEALQQQLDNQGGIQHDEL